MNLKIAHVGHEAAKFAVLRWHYSHSMPVGKLFKVGVWEDGEFVGVVIFSRGANRNMGNAYGCDNTTCCELTRVAMREHTAPVSQVVAAAIRFLKEKNPGLRLVVSYADPAQGHHGGIYQAGNWVYDGKTSGASTLLVGGRPVHKKSAHGAWGTNDTGELSKLLGVAVTWGAPTFKHRYLYPLDRKMRRKVQKLAQPYPVRHANEGSEVNRLGSAEEGQVQSLPFAPLQTTSGG